jgi:hypothetical protein
VNLGLGLGLDLDLGLGLGLCLGFGLVSWSCGLCLLGLVCWLSCCLVFVSSLPCLMMTILSHAFMFDASCLGKFSPLSFLVLGLEDQ